VCTDVLHEPFTGLGIMEEPFTDNPLGLARVLDDNGTERAALLWLGFALDLIRVEPAYRH
jgi:hypothetical protein